MVYPTPQLTDMVGLALHRVIASNYPPLDLYEDVASPEDFEVAIEYEMITSDRATDELGRILAIDPEDRLLGPGSTPVMAAFAYPNQYARFNTTDHGAYYAAETLKGALSEHGHHWLNNFLADAQISESPEPMMMVREYTNQLARPIHDIRDRATYQFAFHDSDYTESQKFSAMLRENEDSNGVLYESLRLEGCLCIAAFKPAAVTSCIQGRHFQYTFKEGQVLIQQVK